MINKKELILSITKKDFKIDTFRAGGKGGQNQNSRSTGVRVTHVKSGATGEARDSRSQRQNKQNAFKRLVNSDTFQEWLRIECSKILSKKQDLEELVNQMLQQENLLIETYNPND